MQPRNPIGTDGFDFLEFTTPHPDKLAAQFESMGFRPVAKHASSPVIIYQQNDIRFFINQTDMSQASQYAKFHGASVSAMGFKVRDANMALQFVRLKGATPYQPLDEKMVYDMPAIYGVGNTLIYFVDYKKGVANYAPQFVTTEKLQESSFKFSHLDHVSFNLYRGHLVKWMEFFTRLFNFHEVPSTSRQNKNTGFKNKFIESTCKKIRISLNESADDKSKVEAFLNHFNGEGIERIALGTSSQTTTQTPLIFLETVAQIQQDHRQDEPLPA